MLIKVFARGVGSGYGPVKYVCDIMPFNKIPKRTPAPKVLKGNPDDMIQLIDIVPFKHKYTSGVISFAKEDMPTNLQLDEVMSDFEELAFAGLQM